MEIWLWKLGQFAVHTWDISVQRSPNEKELKQNFSRNEMILLQPTEDMW